MKKQRKILMIIGILSLTMIGTSGGYFLGKHIAASDTSGSFLEQSNANAEETIAVVNLDEGIMESGSEKIYYADSVIQFPNDAYLYTSCNVIFQS